MRPPLAAAALVALSACAPRVALRERSPDKLRVAEIREDPRGRQYVLVDGEPRAPWAGVGALSWSPSSDRVAYVTSHAGRSHVVIGARSFGPFDGVGELVWSPDGLELAIVLERGGAWTVARTRGDALREGPLVDGVARGTVRFGPARRDGSRLLTWVAIRVGAERLVVDGDGVAMGPAFSAILPADVDATGAHVVSRGRSGKTWSVTVDATLAATSEEVPQVVLGDGVVSYAVGRAGRTTVHQRRLDAPGDASRGLDLGPFDRVGLLRGPTLAFAARRGDRDVVVVRGKELGPFPEVVPMTLLESPGGARVVFAATAPRGIGFFDEATLLQDGFDEVSPPEFSPDGRFIGFFARTAGVVHLHVRGDRHLAAPEPTGLALSATRFAYVARRGARMALVHDRGEIAHDLIFEGSVVFDERERLGFVAGEGADRSLFVALEGGPRLAIDKDARVDFFRDLVIDPLDPDGASKQRLALQAWVRAARRRATPPGPGDPFRDLPPAPSPADR